MRLSAFARLAVLGFVMVAPMQAMAQGMVVSSFNCHQSLPCDGNDPEFPSTDKIIADSSGCAAHYMQPIQGVPVFDEIAGLSSDGCLTTNPAAFPKVQNSTIPHCCIRPGISNKCVMFCQVMTQ